MSVVLPASGCEMIAKVRRRATSAASVSEGSDILSASASPGPPGSGASVSESANAYSSAREATADFTRSAPPWPACLSILRRTGPPVDAACRAAANLRACIGSTRSSLSAERRRTDGYFVPAFTCWYGE